jgi:hypothetical protein
MQGYIFPPCACWRSVKNTTSKHPVARKRVFAANPQKYHLHSEINPGGGGHAGRVEIVCFPGHDWLLFDLKDDPYELANLCHDMAYQQKKEELHALLQKWIDGTGDSFLLPISRCNSAAAG